MLRVAFPLTLILVLIPLASFTVGSSALGAENKALPAGVTPKPVVAGQCFVCHGPAGISQSSEWPNIAGQQEIYLDQQLKAFRSGARQNTMMETMAKTLTDQDIDLLARYFSQLPASK